MSVELQRSESEDKAGIEIQSSTTCYQFSPVKCYDECHRVNNDISVIIITINC